MCERHIGTRNPHRHISDDQREAIVHDILLNPTKPVTRIAQDAGVSHSPVEAAMPALQETITKRRQEWIDLHDKLGRRAYARVSTQIDDAPIRDATRVYAVASDKLTALMYPPAHVAQTQGVQVVIHTDPATAEGLARVAGRLQLEGHVDTPPPDVDME